MKKTMIALLLICSVVAVLSGCGQTETAPVPAETEATPTETASAPTEATPAGRTEPPPVIYEEKEELWDSSVTIDENDELWDSYGEDVNGKAIKNAKTAVKIASALLEQFQEEGYFPDYRLLCIGHDPEKGVWIITFQEDYDHSEGIMVGADFTIALQEDDGRIIGMWVGE